MHDQSLLSPMPQMIFTSYPAPTGGIGIVEMFLCSWCIKLQYFRSAFQLSAAKGILSFNMCISFRYIQFVLFQ